MDSGRFSTLGAEPGESFFGFDELIFSRTDPRGVIVSGNSVFQRMCERPWPDLIGAPHRLIRHPDMPRGFFHLFWGLLKQGLPAAGFVKNARAGGGHYWVLAAAAPCEGGYFSVRIRPTTPLFATIKAEYAALRRRERDENLSPEESAAQLVERLRHHGFADYDAFAAQVVADEMRSRDSRLGVAALAQAEGLSHLLATLIETLEEQSRLVTQFADLVLLPVNMRLVAARLEPQGGPISQISVNYKLASEEISRRLTSIVSGKGNICGRMAQGVRQSLTLSCFVRLQQELIDRDDRKANENSPEERRREMAVMREVRDGYRNQTSTALSEAIALAAQLSDASADLRRMILGLDTIRILARVESRKSTESQAALTATIDRIDEVQGLIGESLKRMSMQTATINAGLAAIQRERGTAAIAAS
ncbi:MAG: histidine kinase [Fuscovulum sp.]|nr:histidine kinase [Fuscovulum sp.]